MGFIYLLLLLMSPSISYGIVCTLDACNNVNCSRFPNENTCEGTIIPFSSFCGCCSTCEIYKGDGERCTNKKNAIRGNPPPDYSYVCRSGLTCLDEVCT